MTSFSDQPRRNCTDPTDTAICCSLEPVDLNGIMWKGGSLNSSVFDLVAPDPLEQAGGWRGVFFPPKIAKLVNITFYDYKKLGFMVDIA